MLAKLRNYRSTGVYYTLNLVLKSSEAFVDDVSVRPRINHLCLLQETICIRSKCNTKHSICCSKSYTAGKVRYWLMFAVQTRPMMPRKHKGDLEPRRSSRIQDNPRTLYSGAAYFEGEQDDDDPTYGRSGASNRTQRPSNPRPRPTSASLSGLCRSGATLASSQSRKPTLTFLGWFDPINIQFMYCKYTFLGVTCPLVHVQPRRLFGTSKKDRQVPG